MKPRSKPSSLRRTAHTTTRAKELDSRSIVSHPRVDPPSLSEKVFVGLTAFACAEALSKTLATLIPSTGAALHVQRIAPGVSVGGVGLGMRASGSQVGSAIIIGGILSAVKNYI